MGLNIIIGPPSGFHDWSESDWDTFWDTEKLEATKLGNWNAIAETLETIRINLDNNQAGSVFPVFNQINHNGFTGWYHDELPFLIQEILKIKDAFKKLPITQQFRMEIDYKNNKATFVQYDGIYLDNLMAEFKRQYPQKAPENLYVLNHHFLDTIENCAQKALTLHKGLLYC